MNKIISSLSKSTDTSNYVKKYRVTHEKVYLAHSNLAKYVYIYSVSVFYLYFSLFRNFTEIYPFG